MNFISVIRFILLISIALLGASAHALLALPTTGTCGFLITEPVPYGMTDVDRMGETGYNFMGVIVFNNASSATLNGVYMNAVYSSQNSPQLRTPAYLNNAAVSIAPLTASNGFLGGYRLVVTGQAVMANKTTSKATLNINALPVNGGKSILLQFADGTQPGSGVCQMQ
ncbi:hypothetical protein [Limnohabitans sp.]|uniref:hypothetical protein n=1 Tax=Limnohabitans sp. TaxID=1907725 RepID=UPI002AFF0DE7|nr:hypothetical protein [Limnohabitans sp.]